MLSRNEASLLSVMAGASFVTSWRGARSEAICLLFTENPAGYTIKKISY